MSNNSDGVTLPTHQHYYIDLRPPNFFHIYLRKRNSTRATAIRLHSDNLSIVLKSMTQLSEKHDKMSDLAKRLHSDNLNHCFTVV